MDSLSWSSINEMMSLLKILIFKFIIILLQNNYKRELYLESK